MDTSPVAIETRLAAFRQRCADIGLTLTPQRLAIYEMLAGTGEHPAAEDIFRQLKPTMPSLSLGTVYRTLELFEGHGLVSRDYFSDDQARFDANLDAHHHLVCVRCHRVTDIQDERLEELPVGLVAPPGFRVLRHQVHVLGVCPDCRDKG